MNVPDVPITQPWLDAISGWLLQMSCDGFAPTTTRSRKSAAKVLARCMIAAGRTDPDQVTRQDLTQYMIARREGATGVEGTSTHHANIGSFWKWWSADEEAPNPMAKISAPRTGPLEPPDVLTDEEFSALLGACAGNTIEALRNKALVLLLATSGLRRAECAALVADDVDLQAQTVLVRCGKGGKMRVATFNKMTALALSKYLRRRSRLVRGDYSTDRVFVSLRRGLPMTPSGIGQVIDAIGERAGVRAHPHRFRHRWADKSLRNGVQEHDLMKLAGWSSSQMIGRYGAALATERAVAAGLAVADKLS